MGIKFNRETTRNDTATDCINIVGITIHGNATSIWDFVLIDGHRTKGSKLGKRSGNLDEPFIKESYRQTGIDRDKARDLATTNADQETKKTLNEKPPRLSFHLVFSWCFIGAKFEFYDTIRLKIAVQPYLAIRN